MNVSLKVPFLPDFISHSRITVINKGSKYNHYITYFAGFQFSPDPLSSLILGPILTLSLLSRTSPVQDSDSGLVGDDLDSELTKP